MYLDRFLAACPGFVVCSLTVHRVACTSLLLAVKFLDDFTFKNSYYANVSGVTLKELNALELLFVKRLGFDIFVGDPEFRRYTERVRTACRGAPPAT